MPHLPIQRVQESAAEKWPQRPHRKGLAVRSDASFANQQDSAASRSQSVTRSRGSLSLRTLNRACWISLSGLGCRTRFRVGSLNSYRRALLAYAESLWSAYVLCRGRGCGVPSFACTRACACIASDYLNKLGVRVKQRDGTNCFNRLLEYGLTCVWVAGTQTCPTGRRSPRKGSSTNPDP
jgi:hypothetical protein